MNTNTSGTQQREDTIAEIKADRKIWDLVVIGGGITGAGIFREAVRQGYRTLLVEKHDYSWGTSSRSSRMVHGGLRYLASGQYRITRDSVRERERFIAEVPGLVDPLPYIMPHYANKSPSPRVFNVLLSVYDHIASRRTRHFLKPHKVQHWLPEIDMNGLVGGTRYEDAVTDDCRMVLRLIQEACDAGGTAVNYTAAEAVVPGGVSEPAQVTLKDHGPESPGESWTVRSHAVISATGPWTDRVRSMLGADEVIRPLRGSHLLVPFWRLPVMASLTMRHPEDKRALFIFPWEGATVIGTTDLDHEGDLDDEVAISDEEVRYLLAAANAAFPRVELSREDVVSTWSGVRPIVVEGDDPDKPPSGASREHVIWDDGGVISVAGGKLTTFRIIANDALTKAARYLPGEGSRQKSGRAGRGVSAPEARADRVFDLVESSDPPADISVRQWHRVQGWYGNRTAEMLASGPHERIADTDMLYAELAFAARREHVVHLDDLLLRRSRVGLLIRDGGEAVLEKIGALCRPILGWDTARWNAEVERYQAIREQAYSLPGAPVHTP